MACRWRLADGQPRNCRLQGRPSDNREAAKSNELGIRFEDDWLDVYRAESRCNNGIGACRHSGKYIPPQLNECQRESTKEKSFPNTNTACSRFCLERLSRLFRKHRSFAAGKMSSTCHSFKAKALSVSVPVSTGQLFFFQ